MAPCRSSHFRSSPFESDVDDLLVQAILNGPNCGNVIGVIRKKQSDIIGIVDSALVQRGDDRRVDAFFYHAIDIPLAVGTVILFRFSIADDNLETCRLPERMEIAF